MNIITDFKSPNFDDRPDSIDMLIVHSTHISFQESLDTLCSAKKKVSSHYLINQDGKVYQLVDDHKRAWHAGISHWHGRAHINNYSIGIELVDTTDHNVRLKSFSKVQLQAMVKLSKSLMEKHLIPQRYILAHSDVSPNRKADPSEYFDWKFLAQHGIGLYHDVDYHKSNNSPLVGYGSTDHMVKNIQEKLMTFGYNVEINGVYDDKTRDIIVAFKRHFNPHIIDYTCTQLDLDILDSLLAKLTS